MSKSVTSYIVEFLREKKPMGGELKAKAIEHITDGIAVMLAGSRTDAVKKLVDFSSTQTQDSTSTLLGLASKTSPTYAALVNGTSGHADDYDDTQLASSPDRVYGLMTHPTVPVLSSALAAGEYVSCTGAEFLEAFIAGFEVECKVAEAINPQHYMRGFHSTGTIGAFGAFAASAKLMDLGEDELRYALGITASLSSGIRVNFGTMTKPLHAGRAAANGLTASMLGRMGFTADRDSLDGRWGFFNVLGDGYDPEKVAGKLGNPYSILDPGASVKMYPCGVLGQPSMDALLEMVKEYDIQADEIKEIRLRAGPNILEPLRYVMPTDGLQAKFSLQFGLASIALQRRAGLREYTTEFVTSPRIVEMMRKVKTINDPEIARMGTDKMRSVVEIDLYNLKTMRRMTDTTRGTPEKPLMENELYEKFSECASFVFSQDEVSEIYDEIRNIDKLNELTELTRLLSACTQHG
jgi:2-methylcitrate dehydratase PrpD